jgi:hypothetical protein
MKVSINVDSIFLTDCKIPRRSSIMGRSHPREVQPEEPKVPHAPNSQSNLRSKIKRIFTTLTNFNMTYSILEFVKIKITIFVIVDWTIPKYVCTFCNCFLQYLLFYNLKFLCFYNRLVSNWARPVQQHRAHVRGGHGRHFRRDAIASHELLWRGPRPSIGLLG